MSFRVTLTAAATSESQAKAMADLLEAMATRIHPSPEIEITEWETPPSCDDNDRLVRVIDRSKR